MRLTFAIVLAGLACAMAAAPALAGSNTKVDLYDEDTGTHVGFVNYSQGPSGDLRLVVAIKGADPGSSYLLSMVCGAEEDHSNPCAEALDLGTGTTNNEGNGNSGAVHVSAAALRETFGTGTSAVHIELGKTPGGGCLMASGIVLVVPGPIPFPEG